MMTDEEWENLNENVETADLLSAVDAVDSLRAELNDGKNLEPPELQSDLLKLYGLAIAVVIEGDVTRPVKCSTWPWTWRTRSAA